MAEPIPAQRAPHAVELAAGRKYFWCACGRRRKQPFCDGSHKGTGRSPLPFDANEDGTVRFSDCKATRHQPTCDGTHNAL